MSLLEAFLSHHYRFLVEQDSRVKQKARRAISAKLESIENFAPVLFTKGQTASERVGFPRCFFVNSHSGISQFSDGEKRSVWCPPPSLPSLEHCSDTFLWMLKEMINYLPPPLLARLFVTCSAKLSQIQTPTKKVKTFHASPCQPSLYIDLITFLWITLFFCQEKQHFTSIFWNFINDTRLAERKIFYLIQHYLMLIQDYLSRKENVLTRSSPFQTKSV